MSVKSLIINKIEWKIKINNWDCTINLNKTEIAYTVWCAVRYIYI